MTEQPTGRHLADLDLDTEAGDRARRAIQDARREVGEEMWHSHARIRAAQDDAVQAQRDPLGGPVIAWDNAPPPLHYQVRVEWLDGEVRLYRVGGTAAAMMLDERGFLRLHLGNGDGSQLPMLVAIIPTANVREFGKVYE
jgi:hypothetical protein